MSAYVRLVESLLVEMTVAQRKRRNRRNRRRNRNKRNQNNQVDSRDVVDANRESEPSPLDPTPSPVDPSPGAQDAIDNAKQDQETETKPETKPDKEDKTPEKEKPTPRYDLDRTSRGTTDVGNMLGASKYGRSKGAEAARKVRAKGGSNVDAERAARVASRAGEAQFRRGVETIGRGASKAIRKGLNKGKNLPSAGQSLV